jgi:hypothetical protein
MSGLFNFYNFNLQVSFQYCICHGIKDNMQYLFLKQ